MQTTQERQDSTSARDPKKYRSIFREFGRAAISVLNLRFKLDKLNVPICQQPILSASRISTNSIKHLKYHTQLYFLQRLSLASVRQSAPTVDSSCSLSQFLSFSKSLPSFRSSLFPSSSHPQSSQTDLSKTLSSKDLPSPGCSFLVCLSSARSWSNLTARIVSQKGKSKVSLNGDDGIHMNMSIISV